jgi:DNA-directed RNA polymerase subunit RPC12/RpoP
MSEFKFLCPVCSQHIATDSTASGSQIECPTCFQKIVIPQAPSTPSKYILSATQYIKPPPVPTLPQPASTPQRRGIEQAAFLALLLVCVAGVAFYVVHKAKTRMEPPPQTVTTNATDVLDEPLTWRMDLDQAAIPDKPASGRVHRRPFVCERAVFQNGALALRQGPAHDTEATVNLYFTTEQASELSQKQFNIRPGDPKPPVRIVFRWKEGDLHVSEPFTNGYALKLQFGPVESDRLPGKLYLSAPDHFRSFLAGTFTADIRSLPPQKQR